MRSLRPKFKCHMTKWCAMFKRRSHPGEEESQSFHQPKQQRTMTTGAGSEDDQNSVSFAAFAYPPSTVTSPLPTGGTASALSSSTSGSTGDFPSHGSIKTPEVGAPGSSAANPIDLTESADSPSSSSDNLIDLTGMFEPARPDSSTPAIMETDKQRSAQIQHDRAVAQSLQEEFDRGDGGCLRTESVDMDFAQLDGIIDFWRRLQASRCANCKEPIKIEVAELIRRTKQLLNETHFFHPCFFCASCKGWSCIGGDTYHASDWMPTLKHVVSAKTFKSTWCCDQGRLFLIFCLLCGHEPPASPAAPALKKARKPRSKSEPSSGAETKGRAPKKSHLSKGTGYGDTSPTWLATRGRPEESHSAGRAGAGKIDELELYFEALAAILRSDTKGKSRLDCFPKTLVTAMIWRSPMLQHASELLRQAAIQEISARCGPITAVLDFLETLASHFNTCPVLLRPRTLFPASEQLISAALGESKNKSAAGAAQHESTQSLAAIVEHLAVPCRTFVQKSSKLGNIDKEDGATLLAVVQRICNMADWFVSLRGQLAIEESQGACQPSTSSASQSSRPTANVTTRGMVADAAKKAGAVEFQEVAKAAAEWHRANCIKEVPDETILKNFHYRTAALSAETSRPAPQRMRKLLAQISSLSTDLPDGIYVRHGESRLDVLKVLIVGPTDTPYEHGLFEFDMFCPSDFPQKPPMMFFRTTGAGQVAFNPNLYANGKVCLSLLGTWSGQPWEPNRSSILQILVSIQAMIFNDKPFYNEPGYEYMSDDRRSEQYNRNIELRTVEHGILGWLTERLVGPTSQASAETPLASAMSDPKPSVTGATGDNNNSTSSMAGTAHLSSAPMPGVHAVSPLASQYYSQLLTGNVHGHPAGTSVAHAYPAMMSHPKAHPGINAAAHCHPASAIAAQPHQGTLQATQAQPGNKTAAQGQHGNQAPFYASPSNSVAVQTPQVIPTASQPYQPHPSIYDLDAADDFLLMQALTHLESGGAVFEAAGTAGTSQMSGGLQSMAYQIPAGLWPNPVALQPAAASPAPVPPSPQTFHPSAPGTSQLPHHLPQQFQLIELGGARRLPRYAPQPPQEDDPIWGDVIRKHFELKGKLIVETVNKWEKQAMLSKNTGSFRNHSTAMVGAACRLLAQLARHGFVH